MCVCVCARLLVYFTYIASFHSPTLFATLSPFNNKSIYITSSSRRSSHASGTMNILKPLETGLCPMLVKHRHYRASRARAGRGAMPKLCDGAGECCCRQGNTCWQVEMVNCLGNKAPHAVHIATRKKQPGFSACSVFWVTPFVDLSSKCLFPRLFDYRKLKIILIKIYNIIDQLVTINLLKNKLIKKWRVFLNPG